MAHCTLAPRSQGGAVSPLKRLRGTLAGEEIGNQLRGRRVRTPQQRTLRVVAPCTHCVDFTTGVLNIALHSVFLTVAGALWQTGGVRERGGGRDRRRGRGRDRWFGTVHDSDCCSAVARPLGVTFRQSTPLPALSWPVRKNLVEARKYWEWGHFCRMSSVVCPVPYAKMKKSENSKDITRRLGDILCVVYKVLKVGVSWSS